MNLLRQISIALLNVLAIYYVTFLYQLCSFLEQRQQVRPKFTEAVF